MHAISSPPPIPRKSRWLVRSAALLALTALVCVFVLPFAARQVIGPERLKSLTEQALTDALGRRVSITGDVSIILAPWFGLSVGPLTVADAPGFENGPMFEAKRLEMTIRILPLLTRVVSPGSVRVRDLTVHLRRDAEGRSNWEDLAARPSTATSSSPGWQVAPEPRDVRLENAAVDFHDAVTGRALAVSAVRLATGVGQPFDFSLAFEAKGFIPEASLECHVRGKASFDPDSGRLSLHKTLVESGLVFSRPVAPGGATPTHMLLRGTMDYDAASGNLALSDLDARVDGARLTGSATIDGLPATPKARTSLVLVADMAGTWREILGMATGQPPDSLVGASSGAEKEASPLAAADASLKAAGGTEAGQASASLEASADATGLTLSALRLRLPQGTISAAGAWKWGDAPAIDVALTAEGVDFATLPLPAGRATWPWPAPWLSGATLDTRLELRRCALGSLAVADAHVTATSRNGRLRLYPVSAVLPGGVVSLDVRLEPASGSGGVQADVRAALDPAPVTSPGERTTARARITGHLDAAGAKGAFQLQSQNPQTAAKALGQTTDLPATPLESRGSFALAPGVGQLLARASLTNLETKIAGTTFRGQLGWDATASDRLTFDLACDGLDLDQLPPIAADGGGPGGFRTEGRLRVDRVAVRGVEAKNVALSLASADGNLSGTLAGAEIFSGKLTGKFDDDPSGRLTAVLQLAGAEASRLPGLPAAAGLSGPFSAKATLEATGAAKGKPGPLSAVIEVDSPQLALWRAPDRQILAGPKAVLMLKGRDAPEGGDSIDLDASLAVTATGASGCRDIRLGATGPLSLDKNGRLKELGQAKIEASALWRASERSNKDVRVSLSGPLAVDVAGGGFSAGDLRFDAGGLSGKAKIWKKAGETGPAAFTLETGSLAPRPILSAWGVSLPATLPADRLAKAALSVSGTAGEEGLDLKRLALSVDDTNLTGRGSLPKYDFKRGKWDLNLDRLDWDTYSPHQSSSGPPPLAERRQPFDLKFLREQALDLRLAIGWLKAGNVTFDATTIQAGARGGLFTFRQESPHFYGGRFFAEIRGDARDAALKTFVELKLEGFECAHFLKDWAEGDTLSSGGATFILAARTNGLNEEELRGNLAGNASLQITRGDLKVHEPSAKPGDPPAERIPFDVFSSSWFAKNGVAHSDDFLIEGPRMRVAGKGFVDLRDETINLAVTASLAGGSQVPATIIGPLDSPKLTIDRSKILGDAVYRVLQGIVSIPGKAVTRILQIR